MTYSKQVRIDELRQENGALRRNVADYRARHEAMVKRLRDISQGVCSRPHWYSELKHSWVDAIKSSAADTLSEVAKMPLREAP